MENAIPIMTSNSAPIGIASASSEYATTDNSSGTHAYRAMNRNTTTYFATKDTTSGWLAYDFSSSIAIGLYKLTPGPSAVITGMPKSWTFEGSNNGVDWVVLDTRSNITVWTANVANEYQVPLPGMYAKYRINVVSNNGLARIAIGMFEMFEYYYDHKFLISSGNSNYSINQSNPNQNLIPQMTSNTAPSGIARASDIRSGFDPWKSFDSAIDDGYGWTTNNGVVAGWLSYQLLKPQQVFKYSIRAHHSVPNLTPRNWTFEGSNDGTNWVVLDTRNNQSFTSAEEIFFEFDNDAKYLIYRLNISSVNGGSYINVNRMQIFSNRNVSITIDDILSEQMFIDYGMDRSTVVLLDSYIGNITKPVKRSEVLGSGKVFKQKIDTSKIPFKKASIT
jgi:hypothetical protein